MSKESVSSRRRVYPLYRKHGGVCHYCGVQHEIKFMTVDHVVRKSQGGHRTKDNVVLACWMCNQLREPTNPREAIVRIFAAWILSGSDQPPPFKSLKLNFNLRF
jgi:5-methylcytosine-specific restriction endonuclease McrA